jgi:ABC-type branched-subunit amino acid transport system permease subunit
MTVVGGLGSRVGVILGAALFASLSFLLEETWLGAVQHFLVNILSFGSESAEINIEGSIVGFIGAVGLLLTIVLNPGGIAQQIRPITRWLSGKPFSLHEDKDTGPGSVEGSSVRA